MIVRDATPSDVPAIAGIYAHHVRYGVGTFEETAPTHGQMASRLDAVQARGFPWLVACDPEVVGYAYAGTFNPRAAYRHTVEDSVYVAAESQGRGVGRALLSELVARCEAMGLRQMIAVIGDSQNHASIALHAAHGFEHRGAATSVGFKHGRWLDIVWMQRALGDGARTAPV